MKKKKKIIIIACAIMVAIAVLAGLLWWFIPYFHVINGIDEETGFQYQIRNNTAFLTKYRGEETVVYVPEQIKGRKTVIYGYCFSGTDIEEVYVPETVEVRSFAFIHCENLRKFSGSNNKIVYEFTFSGAESLEEVLFENKIEGIEWSAFNGCIKLRAVDFIENVEYLGSQAFANTGVYKIPIWKELEYVGSDVFADTPWEEKQEEDFIVVGSTLQLYRGSEQVVHIPEGITAIRTAFLYHKENEYPIQVKEIYIPDTVRSLGNGVFFNQEDLVVYIPDSVTEIGVNDYGAVGEIGNNVKIITTVGSYAEEYAKEYGVEYEIVDGWD